MVMPKHLSPSGLLSYEKCPKQFEYSRIQKLKLSKPSEAMLLGTTVHMVLEKLLEVPKEERTLALCRSMLTEFWANGGEKEWHDSIDKRGDANKFKWRAWDCIENYFEYESPEEVQPEELEMEVSSTIGDVPFYGFIDRLDSSEKGVQIIDYKTGKVPQPRYSGESKMQILMYATALLSLEKSYVIDTASLWYLAKDPLVIKSYSPSAKDLEKVVERTEGVWVSIGRDLNDGNFETVKQKLCNWCEFQSICPEWV